MCPIWMLSLYLNIQALTGALLDERGQDLVEYALVAALISLAAIVGMQSAATAIAAAYTGIGDKFATYTT
jgi:pilus assembly protein Flp/PilA